MRKNKIVKTFISLSIVFALALSSMLVVNFTNKKQMKESYAATRKEMALNAAEYLANYEWKCLKTFSGWKGNYSYVAGNTYKGFPYQQMGSYLGWNTSFEEMDALTKDANSGFYNQRMSSPSCPKYETDCSGFASYVIGAHTRYTTSTIGTWSSGNKNGLSVGSVCEPGDLLNDAGSHVRVVVAVSLI